MKKSFYFFIKQERLKNECRNERMTTVRNSEKGEFVHQQGGELFHVDFHEFIRKEPDATPYELAAEFGLTLRDVQKLKKQLFRS